jgi:hypothetical protein
VNSKVTPRASGVTSSESSRVTSKVKSGCKCVDGPRW